MVSCAVACCQSASAMDKEFRPAIDPQQWAMNVSENISHPDNIARTASRLLKFTDPIRQIPAVGVPPEIHLARMRPRDSVRGAWRSESGPCEHRLCKLIGRTRQSNSHPRVLRNRAPPAERKNSIARRETSGEAWSEKGKHRRWRAQYDNRGQCRAMTRAIHVW